MYDDLARTQRPSPLEWVALNVVIPSLALTLLTHLRTDGREFVTLPYGEVTSAMLGVVESPEGGTLNPEVPPRLNWMPEPEYPGAMLEARTEGHVVVRALVNAHGRIEPSSIEVLQAAHPEFVDPVRTALTAAVFRPALFAHTRIATWVTFSIYFDIHWHVGAYWE
jgi:hypothetical protein